MAGAVIPTSRILPPVLLALSAAMLASICGPVPPANARGPDGVWSLDSLPQLSGHAAVYDPIRDRLVVIAGSRGTSMNHVVLTLSPAGPRALVPLATLGTAPSARTGCTAVYDPVADRIVMFGGSDSLGVRLSDVWALTLSDPPAWVQLSPSGAPPAARCWHSAVYDSSRLRIVVYGGYGHSGYLGDVWALELSGAPAWTSLAPTGTPPAARFGHGSVWDAARDRMVVFGGVTVPSPTCPYSSEVWELSFVSGPHWALLPDGPSPRPAAHVQFTAILDPVRDRMVIFGGLAGCGSSGGSAAVNEVWSLALGTLAWDEWSPLGPPPTPRSESAGAYDAARDRLVICGGAFGRDAWELTLAEPPEWQLLAAPPAGPGPRLFPLVLHDPVRDRAVVYGGTSQTGSTVLADLWMSPLAGTPQWTRLDLAGAPPARALNRGFYDPVRDRMVVVLGAEDGSNPGMVPNEVWTLTLGASRAWTHLATTGTPPEPRMDPSVIYDPVGDRLILFGGEGPQYYTDAYALSLSGTPTWSHLAPTGTPPAIASLHTATYDPPRHRMLVFGGYGGDNTVHAMSLGAPPSWSTLAPSGKPPAWRYGHTMVYDPVADRLVVCDGSLETTDFVDELWELSLGDTIEWRQLSNRGDAPNPRRYQGAFYDPRRDRMGIFAGQNAWPTDELHFLDWSRGLLPSAECPGPVAWSIGPAPVSYDITNPLSTSRSYAYTLASERAWPGYPITGVVSVAGGGTSSVPLSAPVPDTAAAGLNRLTFRADLLGVPGFGAWCDHHLHDATTATNVSLASVEASAGEVRLVWYAADHGSGTFECGRAEAGSAWEVRAVLVPDGTGRMEYRDRGIAPGRAYRYALRERGAANAVWAAVVTVETPATLALAVEPASNPATSGIAVWLTLPRAEPFEIALLDVAGRVAFRERMDAPAPGRRLLRLAAPPSPGLYWARVRQGAEESRAQVVVLR